MDGCQLVDCFQFHHHTALDEQVDAEPVLELEAIDYEADGFLSLNAKAPLHEQLFEKCLIDVLQQSRAEPLVKPVRRINDHPRQLVPFRHASLTFLQFSALSRFCSALSALNCNLFVSIRRGREGGSGAREQEAGVPGRMLTQVVSPQEVADRIRQKAREMGFGAVGIAPAHASAYGDAYARWIGEGMHGEMAYLAREDAVAKRRDPAVLVPGARSAVVVAMEYFNADANPAAPADPSRGIVARYARNHDYHELMKERLIALQDWINAELLPVQ